MSHTLRPRRPPLGLRLGVLGLAFGCAAGWAFGCDLETNTHYGPHSGLSKGNLPTPPAPSLDAGDAAALCNGQGPIDSGTCAVSYSKDIWPMMSAAGTWKCADAKCHGGTSYTPQIADPDEAYLTLTSYMIGGKPYFNPCSTSSTDSSFLCNVQGSCGSLQMPAQDNTLATGPMSPTDMTTVQTWVECGAPKN